MWIGHPLIFALKLTERIRKWVNLCEIANSRVRFAYTCIKAKLENLGCKTNMIGSKMEAKEIRYLVGLGEEKVRHIFINLLTVPLILYLIYKFLAIWHQKLLNLLKVFQNQWDCLWQAFKSGRCCPAHFPKYNCSSATDFCCCHISKLPLAGFQKLLLQLRDICNPIGAKDLNLPVLKSFQQIQKLLVLNGEELINLV